MQEAGLGPVLRAVGHYGPRAYRYLRGLRDRLSGRVRKQYERQADELEEAARRAGGSDEAESLARRTREFGQSQDFTKTRKLALLGLAAGGAAAGIYGPGYISDKYNRYIDPDLPTGPILVASQIEEAQRRLYERGITEDQLSTGLTCLLYTSPSPPD